MTTKATVFHTCLFETKTDNDGVFKISHNLGDSIQGIIASIQAADKKWHTFGSLDEVKDRILRWNKDVIFGKIPSGDFLHRPIKVIVFATNDKG